MLFEKTRAVFNPVAYPLAGVTGGGAVAGVVLDFDAKNQMVETNQVLEVYMAKAATPVSGHVPTLQIKIYTGDDPENLSAVQSSEIFAATDLAEGFVLYKAALPDKCGRYVRVDLANDVADNDFSDGLVVGVVRPL